jgi:hypothetical protein
MCPGPPFYAIWALLRPRKGKYPLIPGFFGFTGQGTAP